MSDNRSVWDKLQDGYYKTRTPWPDRPKKPALLGRLAGELSSEEIAELVVVRGQFETARQAYSEGVAAYAEDENRLFALFRAELEAEAGMEGHSKAAPLWSKAWERGHANGMTEVHNVYYDLLELVK